MSLMDSPLPEITLRLVDLFQGPLRDVRFPDADAERLGAAIDAAAAAKDALMRAEEAAFAARNALAEKQRIVAQETERTLAYVRIYAAERADLRAALEELAPHPPQRRGPGRPRKVRTAPPDALETNASRAEASAAE